MPPHLCVRPGTCLHWPGSQPLPRSSAKPLWPQHLPPGLWSPSLPLLCDHAIHQGHAVQLWFTPFLSQPQLYPRIPWILTPRLPWAPLQFCTQKSRNVHAQKLPSLTETVREDHLRAQFAILLLLHPDSLTTFSLETLLPGSVSPHETSSWQASGRVLKPLSTRALLLQFTVQAALYFLRPPPGLCLSI